MNISNILNLTQAQKDVLTEWLGSLPATRMDADEEDVCMSGHSFNLTYFNTGIGPVFYVWTMIRGVEYRVNLSYDDDGEVVR